MASSDAQPQPLKNSACRVYFPILDADGDLVTGAAGLDSEISKDGGTFADCTNEATEIATSSGMYYLDLTSTEMNADAVCIIVKTSTGGAKTTPIVLYPVEAGDIPVNVTAWNGTAIPGVDTAGYPKVTIKSGTGAGEVSLSGGKTLLQDGAVNAAVVATNAIDADALATDAVTELQTGLATAAALSAVAAYVDTEVAAILEDTGTTIPAQIAALNNLSAAQVNAEVDTALADYDAPTKAELDAGLAGLNDLDATEVQTAAAAALTAYDPPTKGELDTAVSGMSTLTAAQVWSYVTRELTSGGGGGATAQEVWEYATRELTGKSGFELTAAYDAAKSAAPVGAAMTLAANSVTAAALASDATAEIQSGLATSAEVADLPTNNELATALAAADDAVLAAIALLNNLSSAGAQAAAAAALAAYDAATGTDVTNATSPLATAAAVAALNNLSQAQAQAAATAALNAYDGPTKTEMDAAFTTADDAVLAAIAALNNTSATDFLTALQAMLVDGAITWMELQRVLLALIAGETTGGGTTDLAFLAQDGLTERIAATVDGSGNRTSVTLDGGA